MRRLSGNDQVRSWVVWFAALIGVCAATDGFAVEGDRNPANKIPAEKILAYDGFEEKLELDWVPVRHEETMVSLASNPGTLTITTQLGSLGGDQTRRGLPATKNLYLIENPVADGGDFVVTTCIDSFKPKLRWQQAGIIIYYDDDHYLKSDMEFSGTSIRFKFIREWEQSQLIATDQKVPNADRIWIRVVKRGNVYERLYSSDGQRFRSGGENTWGNGDPLHIGLIAQNGPTSVPGIDASFDYFEVRELTEAEKNDTRSLARKKLKGKWDVVSCVSNGIAFAKLPFSRFSFDGGIVSFKENGQPISVEYQLDHTKSPSGFRMSLSERLSTAATNGIYEIADDTLQICMALQKDAPAPKDFTTKQGDSRMLITLKRAANH